MGRRIQKKTYEYNAATWQLQKEKLFVYDGWNLIEEITKQGATETSKYFVNGLDLSQSLQGAGGIGGLLATIDNTKTYLHFYDGNGNTTQLIDASDGSIDAHYQYLPFGKTFKAEGVYAEENNFRFSTKYADDETGLVYYGYRLYSSETGRWCSRDPLGEKGGLNLYAYVLNTPINYLDPFGLRIQLMGTPGQQQYTLTQLMQFTKGKLSIDKEGLLIRDPCKKDDGIESDIDELINSPNLYRIYPYLPTDTGFGRSHTVPHPEGGADIFFDPNVDATYDAGWFRRPQFTPAAELAHELLGRGTQIEEGIPHGRIDSSTRQESNDRAVDKANQAFKRMGMLPRVSY